MAIKYTAANVATVVGNITTAVPAYAALGNTQLTIKVTALFNDFENELAATAEASAQITDKNNIAAHKPTR